MNPNDFRNPQAGMLRKAPRGYWAFFPAPLPPKIYYNVEIIQSLSEADRLLGELSGTGRLFPINSVKAGVQRLLELGIFEQLEGRRRNRLYVAAKLMSLLTGETEKK